MDCNNPSNIADVITASGFPHIQITESNKDLAYECCFVHEVITKQIPLLDDLRQGLMSERSMGLDLLNLANMHEEVRDLLFPPPSDQIDLKNMKTLIQYELSSLHDSAAVVARVFMDRYIEEISQRGKVHFIVVGNVLA